SPECSRILAAMGVLDAIEHGGAATLRGMIIRAPDGREFRGEFAAAHGFHGFRDRGLALPRLQLDTMLLDCARAAGARVVEGAHVRDVIRDRTGRTTGVTVTGAPHEQYAAQVVVGADGLRSVVGRRLELVKARRWPRRVALVAHYSGVRGVGPYGEMHVAANGYVGLADVGSGRTNVAVVVPFRDARAMAGDPGRFMDCWLAGHPHLRARFADAVRVTAVMATGPFGVHARRAWAPGAALVGDAADFFDPFTGEGIYSALRGAELLAAQLTSDALDGPSATDAALAAYDCARRKAFRGKWRVEQLIGIAVSSPMLMNRAARALAAQPAMADLLVGVAGDFVPPSAVLRPGFMIRLLA
nr:FAD-dependent monooxygenase [Gemmatimonadaceae bacterium]